jgi:hypothetical protein
MSNLSRTLSRIRNLHCRRLLKYGFSAYALVVQCIRSQRRRLRALCFENARRLCISAFRMWHLVARQRLMQMRASVAICAVWREFNCRKLQQHKFGTISSLLREADKARFLQRGAQVCAARNACRAKRALAAQVLLLWNEYAKHQSTKRRGLAYNQHMVRSTQLDLLQSAMMVLAVHTQSCSRRKAVCYQTDKLLERQDLRSKRVRLRWTVSWWRNIAYRKSKALSRAQNRYYVHCVGDLRTALFTWGRWARHRRQAQESCARQVSLRSLMMHLLLWSQVTQEKISRRRITEALVRDWRAALVSRAFLALKYATLIDEQQSPPFKIVCHVRRRQGTASPKKRRHNTSL